MSTSQTSGRSERRPTLRDVADAAQVSFKTVSRVVNGEANVSAALTERVQAAIAELGYQRDSRAAHLRSGARTGAIGFVLVDVSNPFFSQLLRGIEEAARARNVLVLAGSTDGDPERERELVNAFAARRVDGLIIVPTGHSAATLRDEVRVGTPIVLLDQVIDGFSADSVRSDHVGGTRAATAHLIDRGHRQIAFFGDDASIFSAGERLRGFREEMAASGIDVVEEWVRCGRHDVAQWSEIATATFTGNPTPTAVVTAQNFVTIGTTTALQRLGLRSSVGHIGYDDVDFSELVEPGMTVVPQHPNALGHRAAELLFDRLDGFAGEPRTDVMEWPLIERGSGEIAVAR